jgi:transcriptional regulator with XRE-family HTH domain
MSAAKMTAEQALGCEIKKARESLQKSQQTLAFDAELHRTYISLIERGQKSPTLFRKTKRAERVIGFDQTPDFIVPGEFNPQIVIEAKLTEDDGTARDKITRVQHLGSLSMQGRGLNDPPRLEVIACIAGRGFKVRREDMKKLLLATRGKVFTLENLNRLVECSRLTAFKTR